AGSSPPHREARTEDRRVLDRGRATHMARRAQDEDDGGKRGATANTLKAALNLGAATDERITNQDAWKVGLAAIPGSAGEARNVSLDEKDVRAIVAAAYRVGKEFGEFVDVIALTGARPSQVARLQGDDVQLGRQPRLMMPVSRKG